MARVELVDVSRTRGGVPVLDRVDLVVEAGEARALVGGSGSGKTSLLRLVAGLESPDRGRVLIDGDEVDIRRPWANRVAMVFQDEALYRHLDVGGNVSFPLLLAGAGRAEARADAERRVARLGIGRLWRRKPPSLSHGERAMVAAGRALARERPRVLLLDEPLARADRRVRERFRVELRRYREATGATILLATNDQEEAMALADRVTVLERGRVHQTGTPMDLYREPASVAVASLIGSPPMNLVPARLDPGSPGWLWVGNDRVRMEGRVPALPPRLLVGLHPGDLSPAPVGTPFGRVIHASVGAVEPLGASAVVRFGLGGVPSTAYAFLGSPDVGVGAAVELTWPPGRLRLFDPASGLRVPSGEAQR